MYDSLKDKTIGAGAMMEYFKESAELYAATGAVRRYLPCAQV
jgi:hypothetical protein